MFLFLCCIVVPFIVTAFDGNFQLRQKETIDYTRAVINEQDAQMNALLKRFQTKTALAKALDITPQAVVRAFTYEVVPATWVPKLLKQGWSEAEISALPLAGRAANILSALRPQEDHGADHDTDN